MGVILEDLKKEKDQLNKALTIIPKKKADAEARRDKFQGPAAETQKLAKNSCDSANLIKQQIIALGGINKNNLKKIQLLNVVGFAAVNLFKYC